MTKPSRAALAAAALALTLPLAGPVGQRRPLADRDLGILETPTDTARLRGSRLWAVVVGLGQRRHRDPLVDGAQLVVRGPRGDPALQFRDIEASSADAVVLSIGPARTPASTPPPTAARPGATSA